MNKGLIELEQYKNSELPIDDYNIVQVLDDIIMAEFVDVSPDGQSITRGGIHIPMDIADTKAWRVAKTVLAGDKVPEYLKPKGTHFIFPGDRGIRSILNNGTQLVFINAERIFCVVTPRNSDSNSNLKKKNSKNG